MARRTAPTAAEDPDTTDAAATWLDLQRPGAAARSLPFVAGLGPLVDGLAARLGGELDGRKARFVRRMIGRRYTVTVSAEGVTSQGLIRTHRARWADAEALELEPIAAMAANKIVGRGVSKLLARTVPIPGFRFLAQKVLDVLTAPIAAVAAGATPGLPAVLVGVRTRDGDGVQLDGPLALTSLLSQGLTATAVAEAKARHIPVERTTS